MSTVPNAGCREGQAIRGGAGTMHHACHGNRRMTIKDRLLEAIGDMPDLSQDVLTDLLIEKVEMLRAELAAARDAVFKEAQRADDNARLAREEIHRVRNDPLAMAQGDFLLRRSNRSLCGWRSAAGG